MFSQYVQKETLHLLTQTSWVVHAQKSILAPWPNWSHDLSKHAALHIGPDGHTRTVQLQLQSYTEDACVLR